MKDEREAPPALQSTTLSKPELLHLRPVPQVIFYDDSPRPFSEWRS